MSRRVKKKNIDKRIFVICYEDGTPYTIGTKLHAYRTKGMAQVKIDGIIETIKRNQENKRRYPNDYRYRSVDENAPIPVLIIQPWVPESSRLIFMGGDDE